jgi:hypothetical protein
MPSVPPAWPRWCCSVPTRPTSRNIFPDVAVDFSLSNPYVIVGLLLGALLPYLFGAMGMTAVGRAAGERGRGRARAVPLQPRHHGWHLQA